VPGSNTVTRLGSGASFVRGAIESEHAQVPAHRRDRAVLDRVRAARCAMGAELLVLGYR
jgi:hypothetical protein